MSKKSQSGAVTLATTLLMLLLGSLAVMSASKLVLVGQKTATNTYHYGQSFQAAQAGVTRAISYLSARPGVASKRDVFFDTKTRRIKPDDLPFTEQLTDSRSRYTVQLSQPDADNDPYLIEVVSTGCADSTATCPSGENPAATVTQLIKLRQLLASTPRDALLVRGNADLSGNASVTNGTGQGLAVQAGATLSVKDNKPGNYVGGLQANNKALADTGPDALFHHYFGDNKAAMKATLPVLKGPVPSDAGAYWVDGDLALHGGEIGSPDNPVILIVDGDLTVNGNTTIHGMIYASRCSKLNGTSAIYGALVVEGDCTLLGNFTLVKDLGVLSRLPLAANPGKVIGSWRDF